MAVRSSTVRRCLGHACDARLRGRLDAERQHQVGLGHLRRPRITCDHLWDGIFQDFATAEVDARRGGVHAIRCSDGESTNRCVQAVNLFVIGPILAQVLAIYD